MPETHDYHKLGKRTFKAAIGYDIVERAQQPPPTSAFGGDETLG
jgi:hypothetical protein